MSFSTNNSMGNGLPHPADAGTSAKRGTNAPAFQPQIVRSVRLYPRLAAGVAALVFAALVVYGLRIPSTYEASSLVYADPAASKLLSDGTAAPFDSTKYDAFLSDQMQMVQRNEVLKAALDPLPPATWHAFGATEKQAIAHLQTSLKVVRVPSSYQISITLQGTDPAKTADVVNAVTSAYLDAVHQATSQESDQRAQLLAEERQRIDTELASARAEQTALGASIGVANAGGGSSNPYDEQLSGLRAELITAREAHDIAATQLSALSGVGPTQTSGLTAAADELIAGDAGLASLKATIGQRRATLTEQMAGMTPNNPIYKQDQDDIAEMDRTLNATTADLRAKAERRLQDKVKSDLERTGDLESRLNGELAHQIAKATSAAPKLQRASEVASDIQRLETRQASVDDALRALRLQSVGPAQVRLAEAAAIPEAPLANRKKLLLIAALPLALLLGAAAAVFARKRDTHIYAGRDIEELLGFPPLAILPARGDVSTRVFEEYVLRLAAGIEGAYKNAGARTFLLTAVSLTTDIDPVTTALARKFEELGLDVVVASTSEVIAPGEQPASTELAVSREGFVAANIARIKAEHGLVLIESEALLNCAQTEYVARCADATILLIECGVTTRIELLEAASLLQRLNVTGIGAVLEQLQLRFADSTYKLAIEALDRRQTAAANYPEPRPVPVARTMAEWEQPTLDRQQMQEVEPAYQPETASVYDMEPTAEIESDTAEPVMQAEPVFEAETEHEMAQPIEEPQLIEELVAEEPVAEEMYEPEVAPIVPAVAARAEQVPEIEEIVEEEAAANGTNPQGTLRRGFAGYSVRRPVLVASERSLLASEKIEGTPSIRGDWTESREKMTPELSVRRSNPPADGDASMSRNISWLDRLLGRSPSYSIVPTPQDEESSEDDYEDEAGYEHEEEESAVPSLRTRATASQDDLDLPRMTARLEQISGSRPVPPRARPADLTRLQIVPQDHVMDHVQDHVQDHAMDHVMEDAFGEAAFVEDVEPSLPAVAFHQAFEDTEPVQPMALVPEAPAPALAAPAETSFEQRWFSDSVEQAAQAEPEQVVTPPAPVEAPAIVRIPPRPLSFQQLAGLDTAPTPEPVQQPQAISSQPVVEEATPEPEALAPEFQEPPALAPELLEPELLEPELLEPEVQEPHETEAEPAVERLAETTPHEETPAATYNEPWWEPVAASTELPPPAAFVEPAPSHLPEMNFAEWGELSSGDEPAYHPHAAGSEPVEPQYFEPEAAPAQPFHAELSEADDIEPVYQEASRHLTTGRWDPIPTLRPSENGWRDRPSPVPPTKPTGERRRWSDFVQADVEVTPGSPWASARNNQPAPPTESLPEPMLTRQWGLLSRFQQAQNISSGSRRATKVETERETPDPQERRRD